MSTSFVVFDVKRAMYITFYVLLMGNFGKPNFPRPNIVRRVQELCSKVWDILIRSKALNIAI